MSVAETAMVRLGEEHGNPSCQTLYRMRGFAYHEKAPQADVDRGRSSQQMLLVAHLAGWGSPLILD